ncbi:MAG: hypothetical protein HYS53_03655 [Candidatus Aenigmarchaeota archaeon]|nr:hypothetical protein [Candidatus Aenigmarchaeota archaeon]
MKLVGRGSKKLFGKIVSKEKEVVAEVLESLIERENRMNFDLNGVTLKLGKVKLKLNGSVEVTVVLPRKR